MRIDELLDGLVIGSEADYAEVDHGDDAIKIASEGVAGASKAKTGASVKPTIGGTGGGQGGASVAAGSGIPNKSSLLSGISGAGEKGVSGDGADEGSTCVGGVEQKAGKSGMSSIAEEGSDEDPDL